MPKGVYNRVNTNEFLGAHKKYEMEVGLQYVLTDTQPESKRGPRNVIKEFRNKTAAIMRARELERARGVVYFVWDKCNRSLVS